MYAASSSLVKELFSPTKSTLPRGVFYHSPPPYEPSTLLLLLPLLKNFRTLPLLSPFFVPPPSSSFLSPILSKLTLLPRCLSVAAGAVSSEAVGTLPRRISFVAACGWVIVGASSETLPNLISFVALPCLRPAAAAAVPEALTDRDVSSSSSSSKWPNRISFVTLFCRGGGVNDELRRGPSVSSSSSSSGSSS